MELLFVTSILKIFLINFCYFFIFFKEFIIRSSFTSIRRGLSSIRKKRGKEKSGFLYFFWQIQYKIIWPLAVGQ